MRLEPRIGLLETRPAALAEAAALRCELKQVGAIRRVGRTGTITTFVRYL